MYIEDKLSVDGTKRFWRCERRNDGCKAQLHTNAGAGVAASNILIVSYSYKVPLFLYENLDQFRGSHRVLASKYGPPGPCLR